MKSVLFPKFNVWLEQNGQVVLSPWRVRLLETIGETGSISAAADKLGVPYRRAWEKVHEIEQGLGYKVLDTAIGGTHGGGAQLTEAGRQAIADFHAFADGLEQEVGRRFQGAFPNQPR
ncbi:MAG: LysR family transcriptional regulator [Anaerolineales bacterium]|nr:LysR family transcriptional regulator [Anaerolineales bacterium]